MTVSSFPPSTRLTCLRILLVEDSTADAELLVDALSDELPAATFVIVPSLQEALRTLHSGFDIVVTDLSLPDADGLQALQAIRDAVPGTPVLVMTEHDDGDVAIGAMSAGADDYLVKTADSSRSLATALLFALQRRLVEADARHFERLALSLLDAMESPTCAVDPTGAIVGVNRAWRDFAAVTTGPPSDFGVGASYFDFCTASHVPAHSAAAGLRQLLAGEVPRFEVEHPAHPGEQRWFSLRINPLPETGGAVLTHVDVTPAKRAEQALAHQTLHDVLTGLPNRNLLNDRLSQALAVAARRETLVGVAFLDLDQFKRINDSLGHHAGDELLVAVSERLRARLRDEDTLARFAGDEFVVVWPDLDAEADIELLASRLSSAFEEPFTLSATTVSVTASIGIAVGAAPKTPDEMLLAADAAMYDVKSHGRGRTRMYTTDLREGAEERLRIEAELRAAIDGGDLVLHYQPVIDLQRGTVKGVEALVRWQHADGLRGPDTFIEIAEESGLIVPLGAWVLDEACRQAMEWSRAGLHLDMAVNLSVRQVSHPDVIPMIRGALERHRLEPSRLLLEVTESAVMEDAEAAQVALEQISGLGASLAIDDFGTGYSSLVYLKRYPIRALKIDRSFVGGIGVNPDDDAIVASIVSLARAVGSSCIAEGVETAEQQSALLRLGCDLAQGYWFGTAVPAEDLPAAAAACASRLRPAPRTGGRRTADGSIDALALARIEQLRDSGASSNTIAAALNAEELPNPLGTRWHRSVVEQILSGCFRPSARRRGGSPSGTAVQTPRSLHELELYEDASDLADGIASRLELPLSGSDGAIVVATAEHRRLIEQGLIDRGLDVAALQEAGRYQALDAAVTLSRFCTDGVLDERVFRDVVGGLVSSAVARHGTVHIYGEMVALLWVDGRPEVAIALEDLWNGLAKQLPFHLVCGYPRAELERRDLSQQGRRVRAQHRPVSGPAT